MHIQYLMTLYEYGRSNFSPSIRPVTSSRLTVTIYYYVFPNLCSSYRSREPRTHLLNASDDQFQHTTSRKSSLSTTPSSTADATYRRSTHSHLSLLQPIPLYLAICNKCDINFLSHHDVGLAHHLVYSTCIFMG